MEHNCSPFPLPPCTNHSENLPKRETQVTTNVLLSGTGITVITAICLRRLCIYLLTPVQFSICTSFFGQTSRKLPVASTAIFVFLSPLPSQVITFLQGISIQ